MISNALLKQWKEPLKISTKLAYKIRELVDKYSYNNGHFLPLLALTLSKDWQINIPDWKNESKGTVRKRFLKQQFIYSNIPGAILKINFTGTTIGAYILSGPDVAIIKCTIDDKEIKIIDLLHKFSYFNYPVSVMFFNELKNTKHTLKLEILHNQDGRIMTGGTSFRAMNFLIN